MADRKFYISFPDKNVRGIIDLYWDDAPKTCATLWDAMAKPFRVPTLHAMFAGPEIMMGLPPETQTFDPMSIPNENQTCFASAGELLWFYQGRNAMKGLPEELWEIGLFYDDGGRIFGPLGWTPCNIFGRLNEGLKEFAVACRSLRTEGMQTVEIGRVSD